MTVEGVVTTTAAEDTILTTKTEAIETFTAMGTLDTKGTFLNHVAVAVSDTGKETRSLAMTQMDTTNTHASTKMGAEDSEAAQISVTTDHAVVTVAAWEAAMTTTDSTDSRETCGTRSRKGGTAAGAEVRSDMKHGY